MGISLHDELAAVRRRLDTLAHDRLAGGATELDAEYAQLVLYEHTLLIALKRAVSAADPEQRLLREGRQQRPRR